MFVVFRKTIQTNSQLLRTYTRFVDFTDNSWQRRNLENWAIMNTLIQGTITRALEIYPEQITLEGDSSYVAMCKLTVYQDHKMHTPQNL